MLLPLREAAGLGSPPSPFYTNTSESLNNMLHSKVQFKKSQWQQFNESMKELIKESYALVELAVTDIGEFKFKSQYQLYLNHNGLNDSQATRASSVESFFNFSEGL